MPCNGRRRYHGFILRCTAYDRCGSITSYPPADKFAACPLRTQGDVTFVTLHVIGSNNNLGRTPEMDAEYSKRNAANLAWMREAFDLATRSGSRAIMIVAQADPRFENTWPAYVQQRYMLEGLGLKSPEKRAFSRSNKMALEQQSCRNGLSEWKPLTWRKSLKRLERVKGIEPSSSAWKAVALPLSYTRARGH